jgi:prepilin-type N-terminal cleavage/methylation domain-containing protein
MQSISKYTSMLIHLKAACQQNDDASLNNINGFTFIELIVVISLISIMLFLAVPKFQSGFLSNSTNAVSRWILIKVPDLKDRAQKEQKRYILHVDFDANKLWISRETVSDEGLQSEETNGYQLPEDVKLLDVEYPDQKTISTGQAQIYFDEKGYSDNAVIHIENSDNERLSFVIEPFLRQVRLYQKYVGFGD